MTHIIRQQYVHVEIDGTEAEGLALQRRLPALCQQTLMPALERVLDQYLPTDRKSWREKLPSWTAESKSYRAEARQVIKYKTSPLLSLR